MKNATYSENDVLTVAALYAAGLPLSFVSTRTSIPYRTVVYWVKRLKRAGLKVKRSAMKSGESGVDFGRVAERAVL